MALQDSWRDRTDQSSDLLSLGNSKTVSFCDDGRDGQLLWKTGESSSEKSNVRDNSAVILASDAIADEKITSEDSKENGSTLKEHDYIGMAEVTSASSEKERIQSNNETSKELNLKETELCLGLGLTVTPSKETEAAETAVKTSLVFSELDSTPKTTCDAKMSTKYAFLEGESPEHRSLLCKWPNFPFMTATADSLNVAKMPSHNQNIDFPKPQMIAPAPAPAPALQEVINASRAGYHFQGGRMFMNPSALKNGLKRGYSETMSDMANFNMALESRAMSAMAVKNGDADVNAPCKQTQNTFSPSWVPTRPSLATSWQVRIDQATTIPFGVNKVVTINRVEKSVRDTTASPFNGNRSLDNFAQDSSANEASAPKDPVIGWPPVRSYRKTTLAKPKEMFVKVNMDGVTVGRKVDLNAHNSYEGLLAALEDMFQPSNNGKHIGQGSPLGASGSCVNDSKHFQPFDGSDYILTYEDKDGDWMLVGDVPWSMFAMTVRRLRITRGLEATGLGQRKSEIVK